MESEPSESKDRNPIIFARAISRIAPRDGNWTMDIEICSPVQDTRDRVIIGILSLISSDENYFIKYLLPNIQQSAWSFTLNKLGQISQIEGISEEELFLELGLLIDPKSSEQDPKLRVVEILVSEEGDFDMPDWDGYKGKVINEGIHVGTISIKHIN